MDKLIKGEHKMNDNITEVTLDPVEQLQETKHELQKKIAAQKIILNQEKKKLTSLDKLDIEVVTNKKELVDAQIHVINAAIDTLAELETDYSTLSRTRKDENEEKIQAALHLVANTWLPQNPSAAYIIKDAEFIFIRDESKSIEKQNVQVTSMGIDNFTDLLAQELKINSLLLPKARLKQVFNDCGRSYRLCRYSVDDRLWNDDIYLPITHMEQYFIDKMEVEGEHSPAFDYLMYSLSGGKKENQDHIEKWIIHKVINYRKAASTPDICIVGHVGGNGKGILQSILKQLFPKSLTTNANTKTLNGNFNAIMLGKLIVFFDDQNDKQVPLDVVKQLSGAEYMVFEPKGKDQYEGEKTHTSAWFSNKPVIELTGGQSDGIDRRFSVMATNITFLESIRKHMGTDEHPVSVEEGTAAMALIIKDILQNRVEIAKWFKHLRTKHPEVDKEYTLKALHGEDYQYFLNNQKTALDTIWGELIVPCFNAGEAVPIFVIKELLRHLDGKIYGDKTIVTKVKDLATKNKFDVEFDRASVDISPSVLGKKKQCAVVSLRSKLGDFVFDWSRVSNRKFETPGPGRQVIDEDNLVFGVHLDDDDDIFDDEYIQSDTITTESVLERLFKNCSITSNQ